MAARPVKPAPKRKALVPANETAKYRNAQDLVRETALPVSLLRAREAVMAHMRPALRAHGVTEQQFRILRVLDTELPMDKTTLAARATLLMPSLLRILKDLEEMRLIRLPPWSRNKRLSRVLLSARGASLVQQVTAEVGAISERVRARVGPDLISDLLDLLHVFESRLVGVDLSDDAAKRDRQDRGDEAGDSLPKPLKP